MEPLDLQSLDLNFKVMRASQLGYCARFIALGIYGIYSISSTPETFLGNLLHHQVEAKLRERGYEVEVSFFNEELRLEGTVDAIGGGRIIEIKTTAYPKEFFNRGERFRKLLYQLGGYSLLTGLELADVYVIAVPKLRELKFRGVQVIGNEELRLNMMQISIDKVLRERVRDKILRIWDFIDRGELPPKSDNCGFCPFREICEDEKELREVIGLREGQLQLWR